MAHKRVNDNELVRFRQKHTAVKPCVLWTFPNNRFQLKFSRYIAHIWTAILDKNIVICRLCGALNNAIIRHSVAE